MPKVSSPRGSLSRFAMVSLVRVLNALLHILSSSVRESLSNISQVLALGPQIHFIGLGASLRLAWGETGSGKAVFLSAGFGTKERHRLRCPHPTALKLSQEEVGPHPQTKVLG